MKNHDSKYAAHERLEILPYVERVKSFLTTSHIRCFKFNYSLDEDVQNFNSYEAYIALSADHSQLIITNRKPVDKIVVVDVMKGAGSLAGNLVLDAAGKAIADTKHGAHESEKDCPEGALGH